jgi:hypothetical protein
MCSFNEKKYIKISCKFTWGKKEPRKVFLTVPGIRLNTLGNVQSNSPCFLLADIAFFLDCYFHAANESI